jgi:hypothetical protein
MLDTEKGSPAELVYPRLGYVKVSDVLLNVEEMLTSAGWGSTCIYDLPNRWILEGWGFLL